MQVGTGAVEGDGQREGHGQRRRSGRRAAHTPGGDQHVEHGGDDQQLADLVHRGREAEDQARHRGQPDGHHRPPEQQAQASHDHRLEPDVRHDRLLDLDLISVHQHRRHGHGGQPPAGPAAQQHGVQRHRQRQAKQVLDQRDEAQATEDHDGPERHRVPERVSPRRRAVQVLQRVHIDQRGPVGDLCRDPQRQPGGQQHHQQPVPSQQPGGPGTPGLPGGAGRTRLRARGVPAAADRRAGPCLEVRSGHARDARRDAAGRGVSGAQPELAPNRSRLVRRGTQGSIAGSLFRWPSARGRHDLPLAAGFGSPEFYYSTGHRSIRSGLPSRAPRRRPAWPQPGGTAGQSADRLLSQC